MDAEYNKLGKGLEDGRSKAKSIELFLDEDEIANLQDEQLEAELEDRKSHDSVGRLKLRYDPDYDLARVGVSRTEHDGKEEYELVVGQKILSRIQDSVYSKKAGEYQEVSKNTKIKISSRDK